MSVSLVAQRHGNAPNQLVTWRSFSFSAPVIAVIAAIRGRAVGLHPAVPHGAKDGLTGRLPWPKFRGAPVIDQIDSSRLVYSCHTRAPTVTHNSGT